MESRFVFEMTDRRHATFEVTIVCFLDDVVRSCSEIVVDTVLTLNLPHQ